MTGSRGFVAPWRGLFPAVAVVMPGPVTQAAILEMGDAQRLFLGQGIIK